MHQMTGVAMIRPMPPDPTLPARVEAATGPDRRLDAETAAHAGLRTLTPEERRGRLAVGWDVNVLVDDQRGIVKLPAYTASLDAALTLVPEGFIRRNSQCRFGVWLVELWCGDVSFNSPVTAEGLHPIEALALCIAALKVRVR